MKGTKKNISNQNEENNTPIVYIIMPCYNGEKYLLTQLMSIYFQNYTNWYLIFVNDGSTDNSESIVRDWISHYNLHNKVKVIYRENGGLNAAITTGLEEVKKQLLDVKKSDNLISYCDADDIWTRDKLECQVQYMIEHPKCDLSYHDIAKVDENGVIITNSYLKKLRLRVKNFLSYCLSFRGISGVSMIYRSKYIDDILPMPLGREIPQDLWTALVFLHLQLNISYIDRILFYYRVGHFSMQTGIANNVKKLRDRYVNSLKFLKVRYPEINVSKIIEYHEDINYRFIVNNYGFLRRVLFKITKYPKFFALEFKFFVYEKLIYRFK